MKTWKKLLACALAAALALAMLTACGGVGGQSALLYHADEAGTKTLCTDLNVSYSDELSEKAYTIANWLAGTSVSFKADKDGFYRAGTASDEVKTSLQTGRYATAFEQLGAGIVGADDITVGIKIDCELEFSDSRIDFTVPVEGRVTTEMRNAAKGAAELGAAYIEVDGVRYTVTVFR